MNSQKFIMRENLVKEIQVYYKHYVSIRNEVDVHDELYKMLLSSCETSNWHRARCFFEVVYDALANSFSMSLARLFDKSEKSKSISALIKKCKNNSSFFQHPQQVEERLDAFAKELCDDELLCYTYSTLLERRDKLYAHNDKKYFTYPEKIMQKPLRMYQIWILLDKVEQLLSYLLCELSAEIPKDIKKYKEYNDLNNLFN